MTIAARWFAPADVQATAADAWWQANRPAAPNLFYEELRAAIERLAHAPEAGRRCAHRRVPGLRRLLLPKSRYHLYYVYRADRAEILLLAVWSAVRGRGPRLEPPRP